MSKIESNEPVTPKVESLTSEESTPLSTGSDPVDTTELADSKGSDAPLSAQEEPDSPSAKTEPTEAPIEPEPSDNLQSVAEEKEEVALPQPSEQGEKVEIDDSSETSLTPEELAQKIAEAEKRDKKEKKEKKGEKTEKASTPIIIKKIKKHGHGHHGGAWKIAFADFVTAMMAFFLLMWLVASLNKAQKAGIADYFKQPIKVSIFGGKSVGNGKQNVKGGGADIQNTDGQSSSGPKPVSNDKKSDQKEYIDSNKNEIKKLQELKHQINLSMEKDPALAGLKKQLLMDIVSEGLRIQLVDNQKKPMFDVGSEKVSPEVMPILQNIAKLLNSVNNKVTIQGHTDATPYDNPEELDFSNWELSSQRANAARRALIQAGMNEDKVTSVTGFSSTVLLDKSNPYNPENRRISIIVMKKNAEDKLNTDTNTKTDTNANANANANTKK